MSIKSFALPLMLLALFVSVASFGLNLPTVLFVAGVILYFL
jgi:lipopolysaccharide export LptBFGC system permease protein LptF